MTPETDGLPSQVWRDTVLVHEVRLSAVMPPSSGVDDYWRWRGYQPHPRAVDDMGAVTRATGPGGTSFAHRPGWRWRPRRLPPALCLPLSQCQDRSASRHAGTHCHQ